MADRSARPGGSAEDVAGDVLGELLDLAAGDELLDLVAGDELLDLVEVSD